MVIKPSKTQVFGTRHFKNVYPRVHLQRLDENILREYKDRLGETSSNASSSIKEERACFFHTEVDLNDNEQPYFSEQNTPCRCDYCTPLYEMKVRSHREYVNDALENQGNSTSPCQYLCDVVQESSKEYPYSNNLSARESVQVPPSIVAATVEKCDASTQTSPNQYRFTCKDCNSQFNNYYYYDRHVLVHRKQLECPFCNACFNNEKELQPHVLLHMSKNYFECAYCSQGFADKNQLIKHMTCHDETFFECSKCKAKFSTDKGLQQHQRSHASSGKLIHVFRVPKDAVLRKSKSPRPEEPQQLPEQPEELALKTAASVTVEIVRIDSPKIMPSSNVRHFYKCDVCPVRFSNKKMLRRHSFIHKRKADMFLHICTICDARFRMNSHLVWHLRNAHKRYI